jgi:hypothetical protein
MPLQARIKYLLSEQGRRDSLKKGGNAQRIQEVTGTVANADLECFSVDLEGNVSFDLAGEFDFMEQPSRDFPSNKGRWVRKGEGYIVEEVQWDVVPSWEDLVAIARQFKRDHDQSAAYQAEQLKETEAIGNAFLKDPNARATTVAKDHVVIDGRRFEGFTPVVNTARKRWQRDQDELKKANRATLAEWVGQHGTENQRQRLAAGLLPWQEAYEAAENYLFAPAAAFQLYQRFEIEDICLCVRMGDDFCDPKFQSVDATELTADEWEQFARIKSALPGAQFQLREHRAQCKSAENPEMRRGVIVKFTMGQLTFKREFALTTVDEVSF